MAANQVAALLRPRLIAHFLGGLVVDLPDVERLLYRRVQTNVRITMPGSLYYRLHTRDTRDPDARVGLLQRQGPRVDDTKLIVVPLPPERPWLRPELDDEIVGLLEPLPVVGRIHVIGELFRTPAAHKARHQTALGDHVDHPQLFGNLDRIVVNRQGVTQQDNLHP